MSAQDPLVGTPWVRRFAARVGEGWTSSALSPRVRKVLVTTAGTTVLIAGLAMLVLPGPGLVVVMAGLAILATEFAWAERRLHQARAHADAATQAIRRRKAPPADDHPHAA